jgi:hypothetical protein
MLADAVTEFVALLGIATGLIALAGVCLLLSTRALAVQAAAIFMAITLTVSIPLMFGYATSAWVAGSVVLSVASIAALIRSRCVCVRVAAGLHRFAHGSFQDAIVCALGGLLLIASIARYESNFDEQVDRELASLMAMNWKPTLQEGRDVSVVTDHGHRMAMRTAKTWRDAGTSTTAERMVLTSTRCAEQLIRTAPVSDQSNCHGWVFTGGRYWLTVADVEHILVDNAYEPTAQPRAGDLVIYRHGNEIAHSAIVRATMPNGSVMVEGKWGWMGVYLHFVERSVYGQNFTFYRSPRAGHLLTGLEASKGDVSR